jgi:hypothetical protein
MYVIKHCLVCRPSDSTVLEDAGIEPKLEYAGIEHNDAVIEPRMLGSNPRMLG